MIVITGANGTLGSQIVDRVLQRLPASEVGVSVRDPEAAAALANRGVRVRAGDFTDPASLAHAFEGAAQVLVVSAAIRGPGAVAANLAAVDAAIAVGAERVLYTSHQAASPTSLFLPQHTHAATEAHLEATGMPFVALRNGFYASTLGMHLADVTTTGRIVAPEDGPVSWTAHADLAEAAAIALTEPAALDGISPPLTAPALLDLAAVAELAGELLGRRVERITLTDDAWRAAAIDRGMPAPAADFTLGMFQAARRGEFAATDPTLSRLIARPPTPVRSVLDGLLAA